MALAFAVGALAAAQSRINGQLAIEVDDGLLAAVVSFGTGLVLVLVISLSLRGPREALRRGLAGAVRRGELKWWHLIGGALGATFVAGQGLVVPLLGVALFTVLAVTGNTVASMATDRLGIGPGGRRPITARRVVAAAGTVVAVALAVSGRASAGDLVLWALVLALLAGAGTGVQPALNGQVAARTGEPLVATVVNFVVGTAVLLLALGVEHLVGHDWTPPPAPWEEPVLWLGGPIGVAFILTAAVVVRPLGVLLLSLLSTSGQLTGALVADVVAPTPGTVLTWQLVVGVLLTMAAVALAAVRRRS
jgi:transporter family-2 protein